jgi:hypothetical protein
MNTQVEMTKEEYQLFKAAQDLLDACKRALKEIQAGETTIGLEEDLAFAIAKAEGDLL